MKKTVIVLGTWSSGSGAVCDYLSSRNDFFNPFGKNEFKVVSDPGGIHYLYKCLKNGNDLLLPSFAFEQFRSYIENIEKYFVYSEIGVKKKLYNKSLIPISENFLNSITKFKYYGWPHYKDISLNYSGKFKKKLNKKIFNKKIFEIYNHPIIIPVDEKKFILNAKNFVLNILKELTPKPYSKSIVLNNAADICDPISSTQYFLNRKIICVTRDPRDIFCGMKLREANSTPWYDVEIFIKWYKHYFGNNKFKKILKNKLILDVKFENFINEFDKEKKRITNFLKVKNNYKFNDNFFKLEDSKKNLYKSKKFLTKNEIKLIEKRLKDYLQW